ncbi:MAG TPA: rhomboid family intramembrane serine protease [Gemmataceae bacterium]|nr:rhomboid family intramembrane serine protease [Gemmataceae bacterium]
MGIYDRDYVRREGPSFLGSFSERGRVCKWLVGINVVVFLVQVLTRPAADSLTPNLGWFTDALHLDVEHVLHGQVWRLLTYAFLHDPGTIWHILLNMLFLWWFGSDVEDLYGPREFLTFYLSASFAAGLLYFFSSLAFQGRNALPCIGASGGVIAVVTLCAIHYPQRIIYLFFILPVPLWLFLIIFLAGDAYVFVSREESSTAVAAHLGGALFAGVYYRLHIRLIDWLPQLGTPRYWLAQMQSWRRWLFGPRLRLFVDENVKEKWNASRRHSSSAAGDAIYRPEEATQQSVSAPVADEHLEAKMDAILEKISRAGKESLTESEREFLLRASEVFRRRRT